MAVGLGAINFSSDSARGLDRDVGQNLVQTFASISASSSAFDKVSNDTVLRFAQADQLQILYTAMDHPFEAVRDDTGRAVPRWFVATLPHDLGDLVSVEQRKSLFFNTMLPLVLKANEEIVAEREALLDLRRRLDAGDAMTAAEASWLAEIAAAYEVDDANLDHLLIRVDVIPPSMALAQSAIESGWGTSRFARQGNAVYGQITLEETGMASQDSSADSRIRFAAFAQLLDATRAYARNLNTHPAYRGFRAERATRRDAGLDVDGHTLIGGLLDYSERGSEYVEFVRTVIRANALERVDDARLSAAL